MSGEDENQSPRSTSDLQNQTESGSSTSTPTTYQSEITDLGSDFSAILAPNIPPPEPKLKTYRLVGDNLDKNVKPREMRVDHQTLSLHFFHSYAIPDRVDISDFSSKIKIPDISTIDLDKFFPSRSDECVLKKNIAVLIGRVLVKHIPYLKKFGLERHIQHEFSEEMARKSEVVSKCTCVGA